MLNINELSKIRPRTMRVKVYVFLQHMFCNKTKNFDFYLYVFFQTLLPVNDSRLTGNALQVSFPLLGLNRRSNMKWSYKGFFFFRNAEPLKWLVYIVRNVPSFNPRSELVTFGKGPRGPATKKNTLIKTQMMKEHLLSELKSLRDSAIKISWVTLCSVSGPKINETIE